MKAAHTMRFGAEITPGGVRFALWAPDCRRDDAGAGTLYRFDVGLGHAVPDPASRSNPQGVHGPSEVADARAHRWADADWRGLPWHRTTLYELHVRAFTPEGTLEAAAARLPPPRRAGTRLATLSSTPGDIA